MKLSVLLSSLKMTPEEAVKTAGALGLDGIQLPVAKGALSPEMLSKDDRKRWKTQIRELGLEIPAVAAGGPSFPYGKLDRQDELLDRALNTIQLAADFGAPVWQSHIGVVPDYPCQEREALVSSVSRVSRLAEDYGVSFAIETGPEPPSTLRSFIQEVESPSLGVNYDPANFIIWPAQHSKQTGNPFCERETMELFAPTEGVNLLGPYIKHVHAKDAKVLEDGTPVETPLGEGWIRWSRFIELLMRNGFDGFLTIEREGNGDGLSRVKQATDFLKTLLSKVDLKSA